MIVGEKKEARASTIMDYRHLSSTVMGRLTRTLFKLLSKFLNALTLTESRSSRSQL